MRTASSLLKAIGAAVMDCVGDQVVRRQLAILDALPQIAEQAWKAWGETVDESARRVELRTLATIDPMALRPLVQDVVKRVASGRSPMVQQVLTTYLCMMPSQVRQALRRLSDPSGTTVPSKLLPRNAKQFLIFLPIDIPIFEPGDRPLVGIDWTLTELLGIGGFGEVWKARNHHFECVQPVVLKFYLSKDPGDNKAFLHEAAMLNRAMPKGYHPGLVELRATYLDADPPCLEYEFIGDGDLATIIQEWGARKGGLPPRPATQLLLQLAKTVAHFHSLSPPLVHRDLKPSNVLVKRTHDRKMRLKIIDFGIGGVAATHELNRLHDLSSRGFILGTALYGSHTPLYASPEQIRGNPPDPRDDVHALGVIWHQMITGDMTSGAPTGLDWVADLQNRGIQQEHIALFASCFATRADRRPANAAVLVDLLEPIVNQLPANPKRRQRLGSRANPPSSAPRRLLNPGPQSSASGSTVPPAPVSAPILDPTKAAPSEVQKLARWKFGKAAGVNPGSKAKPPAPGSGSSASVQGNAPTRSASSPSAEGSSSSGMFAISFPRVNSAGSGLSSSSAASDSGSWMDSAASPPQFSASSASASSSSEFALKAVNVANDKFRRDGQGLCLVRQNPHDEVAIRLLLSVLKEQAPSRVQPLCQQLENAIANGYFSKQLVWSFSRLCHSSLAAREVAQSIARKLFGVVPRAFINDRDLPIPDLETAEHYYEEWRDAVCG